MIFHDYTRRRFIKAASMGLAVGLAWPRVPALGWVDDEGWALVPEILRRVRPPTFPERDFDVTRYGADGEGKADSTAAIRQAIKACSAAGGGRVLVPAGQYRTGAIHLLSDVNLHVAEGATLRFSQAPTDYLPQVFTRWEGVELMNYSPFIYAFEQENVAVTGTGTLDGSADDSHWWPWKGQQHHGWTEGTPHQQAARDRLFQLAEEGVPVAERVFGEGDYLRPNFIQPYRCRGVLVEGVTIRRSPMWEIHPVLCTNVTVRGVRIESHGPNNDGCDVESCTDVLIEDSYFDTGDDCIVLKSGRNADGRRLGVPVENVVIRNCVMKDGHGGVVIGSEISGGARNVFAERCQMDSPNLERALRIKTNSVRGGVVEHVYLRDVTVGQVSDAVVLVNFFYEEGDAGAYNPVVRNVEVRGVTCDKSKHALYLRGYEDAPIQDVHLIDCRFSNVQEENVVENVRGLVLEDVFVNGRRLG